MMSSCFLQVRRSLRRFLSALLQVCSFKCVRVPLRSCKNLACVSTVRFHESTQEVNVCRYVPSSGGCRIIDRGRETDLLLRTITETSRHRVSHRRI